MNIAAVRASIESLYEDRCTIYELAATQNPETKITSQAEQMIATDQPCRLSYQKLSVAQESPPGAVIEQTIKLFLAPEITVKPGSKIAVTRNGSIMQFVSSGMPAVYLTHQEILLQAQGWA